MDRYRLHILVFVILCFTAVLYLWNMHDKRVFLKKETEKILNMPLPADVKIINGEKSVLWLEGDLTVFFEATAKGAEAMTASLEKVPYDVCDRKKAKIAYINKFHPSECFYSEDSRINKYFIYVFWSLYEHKGVLHWVKM